ARYHCSRLATLQVFSIERGELEGRQVDPVQAPHVNRDHLLAARSEPLRERADPALAAEQMVKDLLVELVVHQVLGTCPQREALRGHEGPYHPSLAANRAVPEI